MSTTEDEKNKMNMVKAERLLPTEIGPTAASAETQAMVQSRFVMALKQKRNMEVVRQEILKECTRPNFVREIEEGKGNSALYRRPVGGGKSTEGLGIRFVEMALQCMGNNWMEAFTVQESPTERVVRVMALDIEKNSSWSKTITLSKTVERKFLKQGEVPIRTRVNSQQELLYILPSDEGSFATKEAAEISKASRTIGLRLIPGDIQDEAIRIIKATRLSGVTEDPDAALHRVIDGMAVQKVSVVMLEAYLGHPVAQITPAQIVNLQGLYASLRDGETTWAEIMADVEEAKKVAPKPKDTETKSDDKGVEAAKAKIREEEAAAKARAEEAEIKAKRMQAVAESTKATEPVVPPPATQPDRELGATPPVITSVVTPQPTDRPGSAAGPATPPWAKAKPTTPAEAQPAPASLEAQVAEMAQAKPLALEEPSAPVATEPQVERKRPLNKQIKGAPNVLIDMPEFCDRRMPGGLYPEDAWTPEQYQKMLDTFKRIKGVVIDQAESQLGTTILQWIGMDVSLINSATVEAITKVLEMRAK